MEPHGSAASRSSWRQVAQQPARNLALHPRWPFQVREVARAGHGRGLERAAEQSLLPLAASGSTQPSASPARNSVGVAAEWALVSPLIPPAKRGGNKRTVDLRQVVNGLLYILSTGCQWAAMPKDLAPRSTVHDYFARWDWDGTLGRVYHAL